MEIMKQQDAFLKILVFKQFIVAVNAFLSNPIIIGGRESGDSLQGPANPAIYQRETKRLK